MAGELVAFFELLDERRADELAALLADDVVWLARSGTHEGRDSVRAHVAGLGQPTGRHVVTAEADQEMTCFVSGQVEPFSSANPPAVFLATAQVDSQGLLTRIVTMTLP
jgi:hypothetical protein